VKAVTALRMQLRGELIRPGDARYDEARKVYNAMIDKHPALVARCTDAAEFGTLGVTICARK